ncbi:MAG: hypothetical protein V5804_14590 [Mucilaginibacter sp.]|uniref:hypothetical protein n=1 Tax=Mucilaginibacter sp. TaxID=1882438 RepID=UPI0034E5F04E
MFTQSLNHKHAPWLSFRLWAAEHLDNFSGSLKTVVNNSLSHSFNSIEKNIITRTKQAALLTPSDAKEKLEAFKDDIKIFEKINDKSYLSNSKNVRLRNSYKAILKAAFKYEATLHKIAFSESPIIKTPDHIKEALSETGKSSLRETTESSNVF